MSNSTIDTDIIQDGQLVRSVVVQGGTVLKSGGRIDTKALVQTADGAQLCDKVYIVGVSGSAGLIKVVASLPVVGEEGSLYGVLRPELDRDGYGIIQFFVWYNNEWLATGAYSIDIDPDTLVYKTDKDAANGVAGLDANAQLNPSVIPYATSSTVGGIKQSFDSSTGTWTVTTDNI